MIKRLLKTFAIVLFLSSSFIGKVISSELTFLLLEQVGQLIHTIQWAV